MKKLKLVNKEHNAHITTFKVGNIEVGKDLLLIAGPCSVESREQIRDIALSVKDAGANMLRGGAFKPRTSPYAFQGLGKVGLAYLKEAGDATGLPVISEVVDTRDMEIAKNYLDVIQIGARNMQNHPLLKEAGRTGKPVLLKRGMHATVEEWLSSAEYILCEGNFKVILCERGIRALETKTRNTMDLASVALLKELTHLPVITDPTHGTGVVGLIAPMSMASLAAGADGIMIEVHNNPAGALSDGEQSMLPKDFIRVAEDIRKMWSGLRGGAWSTS